MTPYCGYRWTDVVGHTCGRPQGHDADKRTERHECQCGAWDYAPAEPLPGSLDWAAARVDEIRREGA